MGQAKEDWLAFTGALNAIVETLLWLADLPPGKLNPSDAEAMRRFREGVNASRNEMLAALSTIAPSASAEIERCVAQLLHNVVGIWLLHPVPTPNSLKTVQGKNPGKGRRVRAAKAEPINQICEDVFADMVKANPEKMPWGAAKIALRQINARLGADEQLGYDAVAGRLRNFRKERVSEGPGFCVLIQRK